MTNKKEKISICPHCHEQYLLEIELLGQDVKCHTCRNKFTAEHIRLCPFCAEVIKYEAKTCKHCNKTSFANENMPNETFSQFLILCCPVIGVIFTIIFYSKGEVKRAVKYFKWTILTLLLYFLIYGMYSCISDRTNANNANEKRYQEILAR